MGGSQFDVHMSWTPLSAAASSSGGMHSSGDLAGSAIALGAEEAAGCGQAAGRYRLRPNGLDAVEFLFAAGQGEPLRPLSAVASGGESARIMLALKAAPAFMSTPSDASSSGGSSAGGEEAGGAAAAGEAALAAAAEDAAGGGTSQVLVLDELDSGIGSRLGQPVGRILRRMAAPGSGLRVGQVLAVTHLPQVGRLWPALH